MTSNETTTNSGKVVPEFSRLFNLDKVSTAGSYRLELTATPSECAALAKRIGIKGIHSLVATFIIKRERGKNLFASAEVKTEIADLNPHSSSPFSSLEFEIKLHLIEGVEVEGDQLVDWEKELISDYDLEFYQNSTIDFGEIISQYLSLEILLPLPSDDEDDQELADLLEAESDLSGHNKKQKKENPFSVLERLKKV